MNDQFTRSGIDPFQAKFSYQNVLRVIMDKAQVSIRMFKTDDKGDPIKAIDLEEFCEVQYLMRPTNIIITVVPRKIFKPTNRIESFEFQYNWEGKLTRYPTVAQVYHAYEDDICREGVILLDLVKDIWNNRETVVVKGGIVTIQKGTPEDLKNLENVFDIKPSTMDINFCKDVRFTRDRENRSMTMDHIDPKLQLDNLHGGPTTNGGPLS